MHLQRKHRSNQMNDIEYLFHITVSVMMGGVKMYMYYTHIVTVYQQIYTNAFTTISEVLQKDYSNLLQYTSNI